MKRIIQIIIISIVFNVHSQSDYRFITDSLINVTPFWQKGMEENFSYTKTKYLISKNNERKRLDSLGYWVNFKVLNTTQNLYEIEWTSYGFQKDQIIKENSKSYSDKKVVLNGVPLKYITDSYGEIKEFQNISYVEEYWRNILKSFFIKNKVPDKLQELYSSEEMIKSYFLPPLELFHEIIGYGLNINGGEYEEANEIDLGIIKDTLNTYNKYYFTNIDRENLSFTYNELTLFDDEDSLKFFKTIGNGVFPNTDLDSFYNGKKAYVENRTIISFDLNSCLPNHVLFKRNIKLSEDGKIILNYIEEQTLKHIK